MTTLLGVGRLVFFVVVWFPALVSSATDRKSVV